MALREDMNFIADGDRLAAWWYPSPGKTESPTIVMAHGFGGTREMRLDAYAERFQEAGFGVLVFDYRHFGASEGEPRQLLEIDKQLDDWRAAITFVRTLAGVNVDQIALWGTSFSGGHVISLASEDLNIAAIIAQAPFTDGPESLRAAGATAAFRLSGAGLRDARHSNKPFYVPIVASRGKLRALNSPDAEAGVLSLIPPGADFDNRVAARIFFHLPFYRPGNAAARVRCPALIQVAEKDGLTPPQGAIAAAKRMPRGRFESFPAGHFDLYTGKWFEEAIQGQIAFLKSAFPKEEEAPSRRREAF